MSTRRKRTHEEISTEDIRQGAQFMEELASRTLRQHIPLPLPEGNHLPGSFTAALVGNSTNSSMLLSTSNDLRVLHALPGMLNPSVSPPPPLPPSSLQSPGVTSSNTPVSVMMSGNSDEVLPPTARSRHWTAEEDAKLKHLVDTLGPNWSLIAESFPNRDRKRCRERYVNHVDPSLKKSSWTQEEDAQLLKLQAIHGNRWAELTKNFPGRGPEDVKNRFFRLSIQKSAQQNRQGTSSSSSKTSNKKQPTQQGTTTTTDDFQADSKERTTAQRWTKEEADLLRDLVHKNGAKNWLFIASHLPQRTDLQCRQHWYNVLNPQVVKGKGTWTPEEDQVLREKVELLGPKWTQVARFLPGRVGKQCRERYLNHVDPNLNKGPWSADEEAILRNEQQLHWNQWSVIAKKLPGRSENAVKNQWYLMTRQQSMTQLPVFTSNSSSTTGTTIHPRANNTTPIIKSSQTHLV